MQNAWLPGRKETMCLGLTISFLTPLCCEATRNSAPAPRRVPLYLVIAVSCQLQDWQFYPADASDNHHLSIVNFTYNGLLPRSTHERRGMTELSRRPWV